MTDEQLLELGIVDPEHRAALLQCLETHAKTYTNQVVYTTTQSSPYFMHMMF